MFSEKISVARSVFLNIHLGGYLLLTVLVMLTFHGCSKSSVRPKKSHKEDVLNFQLDDFSVQNVTSPSALKKLAEAVREQSDGKLSFDYSVLHSNPYNLNEKGDPLYPKISISLSKPSVSDVFREILKKSFWKYTSSNEKLLIYEGWCSLDFTLHVRILSPLPQNIVLFQKEAADNGNDLKPFFKEVGITFAPGSYAYFIPKQNVIIFNNTLDQHELGEAFIESFDEKLNAEFIEYEKSHKEIYDPFAE
ncbi:MAG: hypothetical protein QM496_06160 [Verrucomicrobiota bacterium]